MTATGRADYTAGLRALADLLDEHPDLPLPSDGRTDALDWWVWDWDCGDHTDAKAAMAAIIRLLPGTKTKDASEGSSATSWFTVHAQLHGLRIDVSSQRSSVCERVVTGTREVTEEIPDPDALAAVPTTTVTKTVEDVEWICRPLLADEAVSA